MPGSPRADHPKPIPLYDVSIPKGAIPEIQRVLESGSLAYGPDVLEFEASLGRFLGNPYTLATGDVSTSIAMSLYMAGVRAGDEVVTSAMACLSTTIPILNLQSTVVWCDVDPHSGNMDPLDLSGQISEKTKAILVYHWAGYVADLDGISSVASEHNLAVVEDAGEALGSELGGAMIGNTGSDFTVFSFYPNRHLTTGEGAAIAFDSVEEYEKGKWLRRYGVHRPTFRDASGEIDPRSDIDTAGFSNYMGSIAATLGLQGLTGLPERVAGFRNNAHVYDAELIQIPGIELLRKVPNSDPAPWVYTFLADRRDDLLHHLRTRGVQASKVHVRNDVYSCFGPQQRELPGVDSFAARTLSIPCGPWLDDQDVRYIVEAINQGW